jgi:hypothetical protein
VFAHYGVIFPSKGRRMPFYLLVRSSLCILCEKRSKESAKMDTKRQPIVEPTDEKPAIVAHLEDKSELGPDKHTGLVDYTGAEAKTDPEEIALVRKIDWRLMVRIAHVQCGDGG